MTLSVRLAPELEARLEEEARRLGMTKSDYVKDALERSLGHKNPAELLDSVRARLSDHEGNSASDEIHDSMLRKLRAKHSR